jgi:hypothetical protein
MLRLSIAELYLLLSCCCLQGPAGIAAVMHSILQHQPDPNTQTMSLHAHPIVALLQLPNAQHISPADFASALRLPLQQGNGGYTQLLCQQPAAQALQVDQLFDLLCTVLQHKAVRSSGRRGVCVEDCERLLALPAAAGLTTEHVEQLLQHMQYYEARRCAKAMRPWFVF